MALIEKRAIVTGAAGVNLRKGAGLDKRIIKLIPKGQPLNTYPQFNDVLDGYNWIGATDGVDVGFVAISLIAAVDLPIPVPFIPSSIGIHVAFSGNPGAFSSVVKDLAARGDPVPLAVIVSDHGLAELTKHDSPLTTVVYRWVEGPDDGGPFGDHENSGGWANGAEWFNKFWERHSQAPNADFHQMWNEVSFANNVQSEEYAARVCQFELELMQRANEVRSSSGKPVKVTIGNYMPGVPEKRHIDILAPALAFAEQYGHALCYHAYTDANNPDTFNSNAEFFSLRWLEWVKPYPRLRVILGEAGRFHSPRYLNTADLLRMMTELDDQLSPLKAAGRQVDAAYWTIRGQADVKWKHDDFTDDLFAYQDWMLAR